MIYPGTALRVGARDAPEGVEQIWLHAPGGEVEAWLQVAARPRGLVIFTHGNYELIDHYQGWFAPALARGFSVLMVEYPGYGASAGEPTQETVTQVMVLAYDAMKQRFPDLPIVAWGRSLGGGAACQLSHLRPLAGLILQSTFTSIRAFARRFLMPGFVVVDPYDNLAAVRSFTAPVLVLHGALDEVIPFAHGKELAAAAQNGAFVRLPGGHNDTRADPAFWESIFGLLDGAAPPSTPSGTGPESPA